MTTASARRNPVDKHDARRRALADSALRTLGELGYARSSLREIANNSEFTHGVVHYYFTDKLELIVYCVRQYKATCVQRYDGVIADSLTAEELLDSFAAKLRETIVEEGPMHRLWYDLRSQSMFERGLVEAVEQIDSTLADMIWRVVTRWAELAESQLRVDKATSYGAIDGIFQQALLGYLRDQDESQLGFLGTRIRMILPLFGSPAPTDPLQGG
jgi:AcrR family transcriptional regulator